MRALGVLGIAVAISLAVASANAWDGSDSDTGASVEIGRGELVRSGQTVEYFDYDKGQYREIEVDDIDRYGSSVTITGTDAETGEAVELEMDD